MIKPLSILVLLAIGSLASAQGRMGSIYDPDRGPRGFIANKTAYAAGDILTVVIQETTDIRNEDSSDLSRASSLDFALTNFDIRPETFGGALDPLPRVAGDTNSNYQGAATQERRGTFAARISVVVVDVLPNSNLVISGRREIRVDQETKLIEFTGIVRRFDVQPDNTVESELVANAEIVYRGSGPMTEHTNRRGLSRAVHGLLLWLWPF